MDICFALAVYWESRGEPLIGQMAVAQDVLNRIQDSRWPDNACGVVFQYKQFSFFSDGKSDRPTDMKAWTLSLVIADLAVNGYLPDLVGDSTHYHNTTVAPYWIDSMMFVTYIPGKPGHLFWEG